MKERPILFSGPMVRAILAGRKTQTRRICKKAWWDEFTWAGDVYPARESGWIAWWPKGDAEFTKRAYLDGFLCPYGQPGDRLWVRETWLLVDDMNGSQQVHYRADNEDIPGSWKPSLFMPRWASRISLEITGVRVERLQGITEEDAQKEGVEIDGHYSMFYKTAFKKLWDSINGKKHPWESNPWVWCIEFKREKCPKPSA